MKCPNCDNQPLVMSERQGVEIDYCPQCRGVWLDRGELDKLVERSATVQAAPAAPQGAPWSQPHARPYKKHKSWLGEIFD
jgi:Zn-finger nucleic acid-binding protein